MDALVTDVQLGSVLAGLRGLGRAGLRVVALGDCWGAAGLWSRYTAVRAVGPVPEQDPLGFSSATFELAKQHGPLVVYPGWEGAITALLSWAHVPKEAVLPYPGTKPDTLHRLRDKRELSQLASKSGLRVPLTLASGTAEKLSSFPVSTACVVKPVQSGSAFSTPQVVTSDLGLERLMSGLEKSTEILIQELLRGPLLMLAVVLGRDQRPVAGFQQIARRTWPSAAGGSSLAVSMPPDEDLVRMVTEMLVSAGFTGLAQIDFIDTEQGPVLIDVNPRYYASLPLALYCGVNLPAIWHAVAVDDRIPADRPYPTGVSFRWLEADLRAAKNGSPGILARSVKQPRVGAMWARDDPLASLLLAERSTQGHLRDTLLGRRLRRR